MDRNTVIDGVFRNDSKRIICELYAMGCKSQDIEEIFHDTMVIALEKFDQLRDQSKATAWCIQIAVNVAKRRMSGERKYVPVDFSDETSVRKEVRSMKDNNWVDAFDNTAVEMDLENYMDKIPEKYAEVLRWSVVYGYTYEEIAKILSIRTGTVRSRISRARALLKKMIPEGYRLDETEYKLSEDY